MKLLLAIFSASIFFVSTPSVYADPPIVGINGQTPGPTPFIAFVNLKISNSAVLNSIEFKVYPKPGSVTRPVSARYSSAYLQSRGYLLGVNGQVKVPVFGLYANYNNTVVLVSTYANQPTQRNTVMIQTGVWIDASGVDYQHPKVVKSRINTTDLSYDFILLKNSAFPNTPIIIDTDGAVRWVGTVNAGTLSVLFFENGIYLSNNGSRIIRMEFDGTYQAVADYMSLGVTYTGHHNIDYGKTGMILDVNTTAWTECNNIEIDGAGNVLHTWNLATIISDAMTAGGDNPALFVYGQPNDWFHNNATVYRPSDDSIIVSSRENFVIAIDYSTGAIKWILGDPTKYWHTFPSLAKYALQLAPGTNPPIGQHSVQIYRDRLVLIDDGAASLFRAFQSAPGASHPYAVPRKYQIDLSSPPLGYAGTATEIWNYTTDQIASQFCSSAYEDRSQNYLFTYATSTDVLGLDATGTKAFHYHYPAIGCGTTWNSQPIHLENMSFN